ncbi:MAG: hypothetical protein IPJ71_05555 [Bdellovibrionales bacterium]|nr:hypothetical protein [Bdellovibrionales bacterium]
MIAERVFFMIFGFMIFGFLNLRRFSLVLALVGLFLSASESWASGQICTGFLRTQIELATNEIARLVKRIEGSASREERLGPFFEIAPRIENYFRQVSALKSHGGGKSNPSEVPEAESAIYDLVWDIYNKGDKNVGAVKVLKLLSGIQSPSIVTNTKVFATAALLNARSGDEEVARELWSIVNSLKPNPDLDRLFGADNYSDQDLATNRHLIDAGEQALNLAASRGNQQAVRLLTTSVEFGSRAP